jgi:opacity protein-like surface antigen
MSLVVLSKVFEIKRSFMKKLFFGLAAILACSTSYALDVYVEGRAAYTHPTGNRFNKIYHDAAYYGGEITVPVWEGFSLWTGAGYFSSNGKSYPLHNSTRVQVVPVDLGVKYMIPWGCFIKPYVGAGVEWNYVNTNDHSNFVKRHINKWGIGGIFRAGGLVDLPYNLFADVFVEYSICHVTNHNNFHNRVVPHNARVDNVRAGVGIGYKFGFGSSCNNDCCEVVEPGCYYLY